MRRPQNWKKSPTCFDKQPFFSVCSVKTSGRFFQIFVAFSEKLNFTPLKIVKWLRKRILLLAYLGIYTTVLPINISSLDISLNSVVWPLFWTMHSIREVNKSILGDGAFSSKRKGVKLVNLVNMLLRGQDFRIRK